jgi:predicted MFS family arabinose efflux permease
MSSCANKRARPGRRVPPSVRPGLPLSPLLALSMAGFVTLLTEGLPAGLLPEMARSLSVSEAAVGQAVTIYAIATGVAAIPLARLTAGWQRRKLLMVALGGFILANMITAISSVYPVTLALRLVAGLAAAVVWSELVPYARRLAPSHLQGRAIALTLIGIPLALSLGIPGGTALGRLAGWRVTFVSVAVAAAALACWIRVSVPDAPGRAHREGRSILGALRVPGVKAILIVVVAYVLAHNILYTYLAAYLDAQRLGRVRASVLLVFGVASIVSIAVTAVLVDRRPRLLMIASTVLFLAAGGLLAGSTGAVSVVYVAVVLWGLGWGGVATLLQTRVTDAGGARGQALFVATCNSSIAAGAAVGGVLLDTLGPGSFPWSVLLLLALVLAIVVATRAHAFPAGVVHHRPDE